MSESTLSKQEIIDLLPHREPMLLINELIGIINPILAEYSSKNSISFILHKKTVILGKTELDITNQILDLVNKKVETIKLN